MEHEMEHEIADKVYIFTRDSPSEKWTERIIVDSPVDAIDFGNRRSISLSGNKLVVGASNNGYAYVLERC